MSYASEEAQMVGHLGRRMLEMAFGAQPPIKRNSDQSEEKSEEEPKEEPKEEPEEESEDEIRRMLEMAVGAERMRRKRKKSKDESAGYNVPTDVLRNPNEAS
jgi:hypothetical protein